MKWNKLLERQVKKYIPEDKWAAEAFIAFLTAVSGSYDAYERDIELAERAFKISEEEFIEVNQQLKAELALKKLSIGQLKEAVDELYLDNAGTEGDELLRIAGVLRAQLIKRKEAEAKLKASEELWQFALEGAGEGVWEYNFITKEVFFSRQYKKLLGFGEHEFDDTSAAFLARIHPDDLPVITRQDEDYLAGKIRSHQREFRILHRNGQYIWVLDRGMVVSFTDDGKPLRIVGTHADITEQKLSEQALRLREEKYRNIIENMNLGLLEVDSEEYIRYANQSFCELSGYSVDELIGKRPAELFVRGADVDVVDVKNKLRTQGVSDAYEIAVVNKQGQRKWWLISGAPRYNDAGELVGSIGIHLDITQQKQLELDLNEARENAEQSARAKETFLANMSHEIRTPMNAIIGMSRQLERSDLDSQQQFYLKTITTATDHLMVVINDILDISKVEAGKLDLECIGFAITDLLKHTIQVMQPKADEKGLALILDQGPGIAPVLLGDPHRLNQVILNLASNAVKFTDKGKVTLSCDVLENSNGMQKLHICVRDTGIGMDAAFMESLFEKFTQEETKTARKYGGTGLGMAITKQLVELMGGTIQVKSIKGSGTEIGLFIPFKTGVAADMPQQRKTVVDSSFLKGTRILLAEDNEMNRLVATSVLEPFGAIITEVINGAEAVAELMRSAYDVVLMDMQMPVMNGLEATAAIRKQLKLNIPIIALTANAIKGENERCLEAGMNSFVSKPFDESDLIAAIADCLYKNVVTVAAAKVDTPDARPLFSLAKLEQIAPGNDTFMNKMLHLFIEQMPASVAEIKTAHGQGNVATVRAVAHKIKPAIDNLTIDILKDTVFTLEFLPDDSPAEQSQSQVQQLEEIIMEVCRQLQQLLPPDQAM